MSPEHDDLVSRVRVVGTPNLVSVPITSRAKPAVPESFENKWQEIVTLAARIVDVPAGLIMRLHEADIEVFVSSSTEGNPYEQAERAELGLGLYCETVVGKRKELLVSHALSDRDWESNPDVELDMVSYFGVPIQWPDGEVFGTFCVLDRKHNEYSEDSRDLVRRLAEIVESDLKGLVDMSELLMQSELRQRELRHRIKNQFNLLLSYLDLHAGVGAVPANDQSIAEAMRSRIRTLARTHERMAFLEPGAKTALLPYLSEIVTLLVSATSFDIGVRAQGDEVLVDEKLLVPLSSIVSELVTNSIKHAFDGVPDPVVTIGVHDAGDRICIDYSDNGHKSPDPTNGSSGLGSMIVVALAAQLSATIEQDGFAYRIGIPAGNQESTA